ncbi:uromodulin-like 1 isoform X2 [Crotalus tigris]|uniref:uromodulin-like 1 isoform X2 n=1 Tax=Crotalus tigris TaxID=88082 RepID=UPI00192F93C6|nr:uromodulin-like 1 isoform X2 [Crotalus tigris]
MMRNSFILLSKILVTFVFILCITSAESASNTFTEKGLSLLGYHLCNYSVIKIVSKTVAYQKSYEKQTPCGGWIPWKMCTTTYYKEEYHPIMVQEAVNVTDCCAGYEQVGPYCSLPINRSSEFASRPGACPTKIGEALKSSCVSDMDCPEYKKCCKTSMGTHCSDPVPEEQTVTKYWYDVSVLVKMDFSELNKVDPKLLNHSRLLHSMITGALWPMNISVYHIQTKSETYAETLVSYVLVGLPQLVPLVNISSLLKEIVKRVYEVIDIVVQDCDPDMPNILIKNKYSSNLLRSSRSASPEIHGSVDLECDSPPIRNHKIFNVTCSSFEASWSVNSLQNHSFRAEVYKGKKLVERMETTDMKLTMLNLEAGVMYTMDISYEACGKNITSSRTVKTGEIVDPVTTQGSNVTDNSTTPFSMTEIQAVTSFTKYTEATVLPSSGTQESSTLPAEKALSASQKMNVSGHVRNDSILNSPETATPAPKWWGNVTVSNGTVAEELSTLPAEKALSASQKMNVSGHVRNDSILNSPETATPAPKWWGNVTILNGTVAEVLSTLPAEKVLSASQKMNVSGHIRNDSISNSPETATPAPKWWGNVTILNGTVAEVLSTLPAEKVLSASQKMNVSGHIRNDSILNSPETATPAPKWWGNVTVSNGTVAEERWTTQDQQNSSVTSSPGVSNIETSPFKRNESIVEEGTPGFSVERFENVISLNVTQNPKCHALNHTLDRDIGGNDSSWSDERNSTASPSSFKANISLATDLSAPFPAERIFFSNVTNTSFQISWTTHFSANTTFHVLLFEEELLIKKVKTQSSHLNISELKAGTLYTVKIKADLYGDESKTVQRKVKTAAQKFNGMVRIVNLNYSSEFSNSRSEKRQNFSKMFLNEVRTSLPPNILQKMDAGMINISIVSIIPGSIVVNYSLLIPIDMDARNVSGSLLEAFRNSSRFEVDNNSLSIYDNNECEREETDCSPNATCYNIYGSYGCKCKEGFVNVNAERPGRNCEVLSSSLSSGDAQSKEWSSTALPLTDPYTSDPMPSSAGDNFSTSSSRSLENATANTTINKKTINRTTNIHDLPQNSSLINSSSAVSIKEAVQVLCEFEKIVISIKKDFLHQQSIPESSLYLGNPRCNVTSSNSSHVVLHTDWNECETEIQTNTTHTIAKTVLRNDYSSHRIIRHLKISSQIHCTFENNLLTSSGYTSEGIYTIFEDLHGSGHFLTEMRLFIGNSPIPQNFSISGSDNVMIEVGVQTRSKKLKLVVGQCWATPTNNSMDPHSFHFIHGSCPVPNTNTIVIANGISNRARFKLKIFSFVNSSVVYLHCKIKICVEIPKSTCRTNCQGFRFWKSGEIIATPKATWGPLHKFSAGLKEEKKSGLGVGYIVLIVIGVLVLALGIAGLLVCRYKRKAGTYDFKRRTEYFNYRAFHD